MRVRLPERNGNNMHHYRGKTLKSRKAAGATAVKICAIGFLVASVVLPLLPLAQRAVERLRVAQRIDAMITRAEGLAPSSMSRDQADVPATSLLPIGNRAEPCWPQRPAPDNVLGYLEPLEPEPVSWARVGGCGVGGGGGGGVRWTGRRAPGGGTEVEVLTTMTTSVSTDSTTASVKLSRDVPGRLNVSLQVPYMHTVGMDENYFELYGSTLEVDAEGVGDLNLTVSRKFGITGSTVAAIAVGVPTGEYDAELNPSYVYPRAFQIGKGVGTVSGSLEHTLSRDWGTVTIGGALNLNGGMNDIGNRAGDTYDVYAYLAYTTERRVHSFGVKASRGLNKDMNSWEFEVDQSRTKVTLQYGLELSFLRAAPVFIGVTTTLGESGSSEATSLAVGVVMSF